MTALSLCRPIAVMAWIIVAGCAPWETREPVTPASYESSRAKVERTVGKLRRLAVLQLDQAAPKACGQGGNAEMSLAFDDASGPVGKLVTAKGYEVVILDAARFADWLLPSNRDAFAEELIAALRASGDGSTGVSTRALLDRLRDEDRVDGLLILHNELTCLNANTALRSAYSIGTLGLHAVMPNRDWLQIYTNHRALALETTSGRAVWRNEWNAISMAADRLKNLGSDKGGPSPVESMLDPLEAAVPKLLTR